MDGARSHDEAGAVDGLFAVDGSRFRALARRDDFDVFMELSCEANEASVNAVTVCARVVTSFRSFDSAFSSSRAAALLAREQGGIRGR